MLKIQSSAEFELDVLDENLNRATPIPERLAYQKIVQSSFRENRGPLPVIAFVTS